jgi:hypothetical protein
MSIISCGIDCLRQKLNAPACERVRSKNLNDRAAEIRRSSYDASRRFKAVTVPGFAFILRKHPFPRTTR